MTVNEIETTLQSLYKRHENLTEAMLITLLKSGGWDEKMINDAVVIHRRLLSPAPRNTFQESGLIKDFLPKLQSEPVFEPVADSAHLLNDHYEHTDGVVAQATPPPVVQKVEKVANKVVDVVVEKQSLVLPPKEVNSRQIDVKDVIKKSNEPPHNLPLKPFETTPHIWQFDRYKSVFYGDAPQSEEKVAEVKIEQKQPEVQYVYIEKEVPASPHHIVNIVPVPLDRDDEKLVMLASAMLVAILLLLGYMYTNGRL